MSTTKLGPHYPIDTPTGKPLLTAGDTAIVNGAFVSPKPLTASYFWLLLVGDQQSGADRLLVAGDQQSGADRLLVVELA